MKKGMKTRKHAYHARKVGKPGGAKRGKALGSIKTPKETIYVTYSTTPPKRKPRK